MQARMATTMSTAIVFGSASAAERTWIRALTQHLKEGCQSDDDLKAAR